MKHADYIRNYPAALLFCPLSAAGKKKTRRLRNKYKNKFIHGAHYAIHLKHVSFLGTLCEFSLFLQSYS